MRRFGIAATTVVAVLVAAATAFAATTVNTYKASYSFRGGKGTMSHPAALSFTQKINVKAAVSGNRTGLLHTITTTIDGVKVDASGFPTCSASKINMASSDTSCPKKALVATGSIQALVGPETTFTTTAPGVGPCDPVLHVWNGGHHKLIFFFVDTATHSCYGGVIQTGGVPPWTARYRQQGSKLIVTIPVPNTVDYPAGRSANLTGSLVSEKLDWKSEKMGSHYSIESTGCSGSKRRFEFKFSASLPNAASETKTTKGAVACH